MATRGQPTPPDVVARIRRLVSAGLSERAAARASDVDRLTVRKYLGKPRKNGVAKSTASDV